MVITMMTLPGIVCIYYGQEIGMMDYKVRPDQIRDPQLHEIDHIRDPERLPMQWDDSINAGRFTLFQTHVVFIFNFTLGYKVLSKYFKYFKYFY